MRLTLETCVLACALLAQAAAGGPVEPKNGELPSIAQLTANLERLDGLLSLVLDRPRGKLWLELPPPGERGMLGEYLYVEGLVTGLGSNPVGLDRGQLGESTVVRLRLVGGRLLVEELNLGFRALHADARARRAVEEAFATSVLWGGPVAARDPDGRTLVDFTSFVVRDAHEVTPRLERTEQGKYTLDPERSALDTEACLAFPDNVELEALLTWSTSGKPGDEVGRVAPAGTAFTLVQHHSLARLPEAGYRPRRFDPRAGSLGIRFLNLAAPLDEPLETRWIVRHRLEKTEPRSERSPVVKPIVYYVDRAAPGPVRQALLEGASWWSEAFEAAGFEDAYRVELLPEGVHPLDVRYNVIQWVHRETRGWSYGGGVIDPRSGEMLKGHVTLGSQRVRQDRLLFEGLAGTDATGSGSPDDPVELALARIRQLSAHEVGHTLGLDHNFAASTYAGRASVMDYPAPLVRMGRNGKLDFSEAYGTGLGTWDHQAIRYAYSEFPPDTDEGAALEAIVGEGLAQGHLFLNDEDADGAAHPLANRWDNGSDPVAALDDVLQVRQLALERFGERNVRPGIPLSRLAEVLAPLYFHHRYQLEAAVKTLGGLEYAHAVRGDGQPPSRPAEASRQRRALETILRVLTPEALDLPEPLLALLHPAAPGHEPREPMGSHTPPVFDPLAAAATAAEMAVDLLLEPRRAARLVDFHRRDPDSPGLREVIHTLVARTFTPEAPDPRAAELQRTVQTATVGGLLRLASNSEASPQVRARTEDGLRRLAERLQQSQHTTPEQASHARYHADAIRRFLERTEQDPATRQRAPEAPPGSPIGQPARLADCSRASRDGNR